MDNSFRSSGKGYRNHYHDSRSNIFSHKQKATNQGFFIKPRIKIGKLRDNRIEDITITSLWENSDTFDGIVWTLPISNRVYEICKKSFSRDISNCYVGINIIQDNTVIHSQEIQLGWLGGKSLPKKCKSISLVGDMERREEYATHLPFSYLDEVFRDRWGPINMPKGTKNEALFLFTFPEGDSLSIIPNTSFSENELRSLSLFYNIEYDIQLTFHSTEYQHTKRFKLIATSWDDVDLK